MTTPPNKPKRWRPWAATSWIAVGVLFVAILDWLYGEGYEGTAAASAISLIVLASEYAKSRAKSETP